MARCEGVPILVFTGNVYTHTDSDIAIIAGKISANA